MSSAEACKRAVINLHDAKAATAANLDALEATIRRLLKANDQLALDLRREKDASECPRRTLRLKQLTHGERIAALQGEIEAQKAKMELANEAAADMHIQVEHLGIQLKAERVYKLYDEIETIDRSGVNKRKMLEDGYGRLCKKRRDMEWRSERSGERIHEKNSVTTTERAFLPPSPRLDFSSLRSFARCGDWRHLIRPEPPR